jgi:hypothetical protein
MQFASAPWHSIDNMRVTIDELAKATMEDKELPVKVEAALALQMILAEQPKGERVGSYTFTRARVLCSRRYFARAHSPACYRYTRADFAH